MFRSTQGFARVGVLTQTLHVASRLRATSGLYSFSLRDSLSIYIILEHPD